MTRRRTAAGAAVLVLAAVAARLVGAHPLTFVVSAIAVVPLAALLGTATEQLALHAGSRVGGLLNATFGNAAELIIGVLLVAHGEIEVVRASITGSIIGNLLLVLGAAFFVGGLRHPELTFSARSASTHVVSMALAVTGVLMPSVYARGRHVTAFRIEVVSVGVAIVLLALYGASLVYSFVTAREPVGPPEDDVPEWSRRDAVLVLAVTGLLVGVVSEFLTSSLEPTVTTLGLSRLWVGLILVPVVGNAAEHTTAVLMAIRRKADVAIDIAVGSSAQIALVVTPVLVFAGLAFGHRLTLSFTAFDVSAIAIAVVVVALISVDGRTDWLEGAQLLGVYLILAVTSFYVGLG